MRIRRRFGAFEVILAFWEMPQNLLGFLFYGLERIRGRVRGAVWEKGRLFIRGRAAVSLGVFVFWSKDPRDLMSISHANKRHEYGHAVQSRLLGPLYLPLVGLPSCARLLYARLFRAFTGRPWMGYYRGYPESWADRLGMSFRQNREPIPRKRSCPASGRKEDGILQRILYRSRP
ncbi:MAG: hypothetical protein ACM3XS_06175 [Bacteroidota bacterium]